MKDRLGEMAERLAGAHLIVEDCWYSCPMSSEGCCDDGAGEGCNCGRDKRATEIRSAFEALIREGAQVVCRASTGCGDEEVLAEYGHRADCDAPYLLRHFGLEAKP